MAAAPARTWFASPLLYLIPLAILGLPDPLRAEGGPFVIHLERGDSVQVLRVEPATFGMFRYVRTDSVKGYLAAHRIRSITAASGGDVSRDVLERRRAIGVDPSMYRPDGSPKPPRHPHRDQRRFPIFEVGIYGRLNDPPSPYDDRNLMTSLDYGVMYNLSRSIAVGGTVHLEVEDDRNGLGLALRGRRWLGNTLSLDGAAGWIFAGDDQRGDFGPHAIYGEAAINIDDHFQVAARVESWRWRGYDYWALRSEKQRETLVQVGGRVGVVPGVPIFILFLLAAAIDSRGIY